MSHGDPNGISCFEKKQVFLQKFSIVPKLDSFSLGVHFYDFYTINPIFVL
jgi:hypothetical protein